MINSKSLNSISWLIDKERLVRSLIRLIILVGWLLIAFGRLLLYLSVVPVNGTIIWLIVIAVLEIIISIYVSTKFLNIRMRFAIVIDLLVATGIAVYVYKLLGVISSLIFVI